MSNRNIELPLLKGKPKEKYIPISIFIGIAILLVLILVASLAFTFRKGYKIHYSEKSNIDYKVYLKENNSFSTKYLGMNKKYISNLIDYIDTDFEYSLNVEDNIDLNYSYYVVARLEINDSHNKNIYDKEEIIMPKIEKNGVAKNEFEIKQNVQVDYNKYNQIASNFINEYKLTANANLIISLIVNVDGKNDEFENDLTNMEVVSLKVPLSEKTVDITMDYDLVNSNDKVLQQSNMVLKNKPLLFTVLFLSFIDVAVIIYIVCWVISNRDGKTQYLKKFNKIKRDYGRYISETVITERAQDLMLTRSLRIVCVKDFKNLLDIRDSVNKPILYHEERLNEEAVFYILTDNVGYLYILSAKDNNK